MRKLLLCVLSAAVLTGCGGTGGGSVGGGGAGDMAPDFDGLWNGTIVQSTQTCSDGTTAPPQSAVTTYQITEAGSIASFPLACGATFTFNVAGTSATQQGSATCPPSMNNGSTVVTTYSNGALVLNGNALSISLDGKNVVSGAVTGSCTFTITGTLIRQ